MHSIERVAAPAAEPPWKRRRRARAEAYRAKQLAERVAEARAVLAPVTNAIDRLTRALERAGAGPPSTAEPSPSRAPNASADALIDQHASPLGNRRHVRLCRNGTLPHVRIGRRWCVRRSDLDRYLGGASAPAPANDADAALAAELGLRIVDRPLSIRPQVATIKGSER